MNHIFPTEHIAVFSSLTRGGRTCTGPRTSDEERLAGEKSRYTKDRRSAPDIVFAGEECKVSQLAGALAGRVGGRGEAGAGRVGGTAQVSRWGKENTGRRRARTLTNEKMLAGAVCRPKREWSSAAISR